MICSEDLQPDSPKTRAVSIRRFYDQWPQYDRRLTEIVGALTDQPLAIEP